MTVTWYWTESRRMSGRGEESGTRSCVNAKLWVVIVRKMRMREMGTVMMSSMMTKCIGVSPESGCKKARNQPNESQQGFAKLKRNLVIDIRD